MNDQRVYRIGAVLHTSVDDQVFLVDEDSGESFKLGGAGVRYWELLTAGASVGAVIDAVCDETDATADVVRGDVEATVARLEAMGALVPNTTDT